MVNMRLNSGHSMLLFPSVSASCITVWISARLMWMPLDLKQASSSSTSMLPLLSLSIFTNSRRSSVSVRFDGMSLAPLARDLTKSCHFMLMSKSLLNSSNSTRPLQSWSKRLMTLARRSASMVRPREAKKLFMSLEAIPLSLNIPVVIWSYPSARNVPRKAAETPRRISSARRPRASAAPESPPVCIVWAMIQSASSSFWTSSSCKYPSWSLSTAHRSFWAVARSRHTSAFSKKLRMWSTCIGTPCWITEAKNFLTEPSWRCGAVWGGVRPQTVLYHCKLNRPIWQNSGK
mmetsp:Transcript_91061/g.257398  ORF Transcript_91061/g.257398 Transcript_91061/m.257398 type:complete len:290 (+) Transcript_91061:267-1136(+)